MLNKLGFKIESTGFGNFGRVMESQGIKSLIHGSKPVIYKSLAQIFIQTKFYDSLRNSSFDDGEISHTGSSLWIRKAIAAFNCAGFSLLFLHPFDLVRARMHADILKMGQSQQIYKGFGEAFGKIRADEGTKGLWQGLTFSFVALIPQILGSLAFYEWHIETTKNGEGSSFLNYFTAPVVASVGGSLLFYPLETIRKQFLLARFSGIKPKVPNFRSFIKNFGKLGGVSSLYNGFTVALVRNMSFMGLQVGLLPILQRGNIQIEYTLIQQEQSK